MLKIQIEVNTEHIRKRHMSKKIIDEAIEYVKELFEGNSDGHGVDHAMRVYRNTQVIMEKYPEADSVVVALAALLHDADDHKLFNTDNNANARGFLEKNGQFDRF